ncbi:MAG: cation transporter [Chromatiales bacterium]|jgi:copper chaperone CopZ
MSNYLHHVPGRVRVRSRILCRNNQTRQLALQQVRALEGVTSVRLNSKAGSVTVMYDTEVAGLEQILEQLHKYDCLAPGLETRPKPAKKAAVAQSGSFPAMIGKMALNVLVARGVNYSLSSLLGARI